jgi:hypothetical protein
MELWRFVPGVPKPVNGHRNPSPNTNANAHANANTNTNGYRPRRENQPQKSKPVKTQEQAPLCKFANGCTKSDCPFAHPTPAAGDGGLVLRGEMCPDGRDCLNREVHFPFSPALFEKTLIVVRYGSS